MQNNLSDEELEERWIIKNPSLEDADLVICCDEDVDILARPNAKPLKIYYYHSKWCIDHGYCCGLKIKGVP